MMEARDLRERTYLFELSLTEVQKLIQRHINPFVSLARYQSVHRDLAPRLASSVEYAKVEAAIKSVDIPILESFRVADRYVGAPLPEGIYSLTISFTFRSDEGTLTDAQVSEAIGRLREKITDRRAHV